MINTKEIYNKLLNDERITELVDEDNILSAWPDEFETFPCIIFMDENQSDDEYYENMPGASRCSVQIHIFTKKLDGYASTSEIGAAVAEVFNEDLWHCSQNGEVADPDPDAEHRVMMFNKSIYNN
jgi:hypothetical protein